MFEGTLTPIITPFVAGDSIRPAIDYASLERFVEWQLQSGVSGIVVAGTTGESATLSKDEKIELTRQVVKMVSGRVPVLVGTGSNCTSSSIELTKEVSDLGVDGSLIVAPYYNKPNQEGVFQHYSRIALDGGLPVVVYNIPSRSGIDISVDTYKRLAEVDGIVACKESTNSASKLVELAAAVGDSLAILSGDDGNTHTIMSLGGKGVIAASANVIPKEMCQIVDQFRAGNIEEAFQAQAKVLPVISALFSEPNPCPAKTALQLLGRIDSDTVRLPLVLVSNETRARLQALVDAL